MKKTISKTFAIIHYVNLSAVLLALVFVIFDLLSSGSGHGFLFFYIGLGILQPCLGFLVVLCSFKLDESQQKYVTIYWLSILGLFALFFVVASLDKIIQLENSIIIIGKIPIVIAFYFVFVTHKINNGLEN